MLFSEIYLTDKYDVEFYSVTSIMFYIFSHLFIFQGSLWFCLLFMCFTFFTLTGLYVSLNNRNTKNALLIKLVRDKDDE